MHFHILTLFPEMVMNGLNTSIIGRAVKKELLSIEAVNIRDYAFNKHQSVDDYPYGGGAGMLMQAEPVYLAYEAVMEKIRERRQEAGQQETRSRVVYLSPQGRVFHQKLAEELAKEEDLILLCGHYEGIDERVLEEIVTDEVSIGDYVLTGGERNLNRFRIICWNIHSIPGPRSGTGRKCRKFYYRDIMPILRNGGSSSRFFVPGSVGRICWNDMEKNEKIGERHLIRIC